jgi:TM2 domain-containing membrane protein YozV
MDCVNHSGVNAAAYCQNCGKPLCAACVKTAPGGQILCEPCWAAWQTVQPPYPTSAYTAAPNPAVAAALGIIPGVGAMYNGQFLKGFVHVFIFAILVSTAGRYPIFGLFIAAWVIYQAFEAFHIAKARRDGLPVPDPLGLNEISNWLNFSGRQQNPPPAAGPAATGSGTAAPFSNPAGSYQAPPDAPPWQPAPGAPASPDAPGPGQPGSNYPGSNYPGPGYPPYPPMPPVPPDYFWKRKEPVGAVILIALGLMFLLGQLDLFSGRVFEFAWPLFLIGLGVWMVVRHVQSSQGGPK